MLEVEKKLHLPVHVSLERHAWTKKQRIKQLPESHRHLVFTVCAAI